MTKDLIKQTFREALKAQGFKEKGGSWYEECDETILVANLQKSDFSDRYFINLAVWFKQLGKADYPKEHHCHLRIRLKRVAASDIDLALDANKGDLSDEDRQAQIRAAMEQIGIPFRRSCSTLASAAEQFAAGRLTHGFVHKHLRELLMACLSKDGA
jgi:hypothetical protein